MADQEVPFGADDPAGQVSETGKRSRQLYGDDLGAEPRQDIERVVIGGEHLRGHPGAFRLGHAGEPQTAYSALDCWYRVVGHDAAGARIERIRALHDIVEKRRVDNRAGHWPRRVERRRERQYAVGADPADRRLEPGDAAP